MISIIPYFIIRVMVGKYTNMALTLTCIWIVGIWSELLFYRGMIVTERQVEAHVRFESRFRLEFFS